MSINDLYNQKCPTGLAPSLIALVEFFRIIDILYVSVYDEIWTTVSEK